MKNEINIGFILAIILLIIACVAFFAGCASAPKHEETHYLVCPLCGTKFIPQDVRQNALNTCTNNFCRAQMPFVKESPKPKRTWGFYYERWYYPYWSYRSYGYYGREPVRIYRYNTYRHYHYGNYNH